MGGGGGGGGGAAGGGGKGRGRVFIASANQAVGQTDEVTCQIQPFR